MLALKKSIGETKKMIGVSSFAAHLLAESSFFLERCAAKNRV
jgi:hypothetical protein